MKAGIMSNNKERKDGNNKMKEKDAKSNNFNRSEGKQEGKEKKDVSNERK